MDTLLANRSYTFLLSRLSKQKNGLALFRKNCLFFFCIRKLCSFWFRSNFEIIVFLLIINSVITLFRFCFTHSSLFKFFIRAQHINNLISKYYVYSFKLLILYYIFLESAILADYQCYWILILIINGYFSTIFLNTN